MKIINIIFSLICFTIPVLGQRSAPTIPQCGLDCVVDVLPYTGCSLTDTACQCASTKLSQLAAACMLANCTVQEGLDLSRFDAYTCDLPTPNRAKLVELVVIISATLSYTFIVLRLLAKAANRDKVQLEDWIIVISAIILIPAIFFGKKALAAGFGKHLWSLRDGDLTRVLQALYISENIYVVVLASTKISVLVFYIRIFGINTRFRVAVYIVGGITILSTVIISSLHIFQCHPISYFWNRDLKGTCLDQVALGYANSSMAIIEDIAVIILPIPVVWELKLSKPRKIAIGIIFALGGTGCLASIIRLHTLKVVGYSIDPSWDLVPTVIWTCLELSICVICSCLPFLRVLLNALYPTSLCCSDMSRGSGLISSLRLGYSGRKMTAEEGEVRILGGGGDGKSSGDLTMMANISGEVQSPTKEDSHSADMSGSISSLGEVQPSSSIRIGYLQV